MISVSRRGALGVLAALLVLVLGVACARGAVALSFAELWAALIGDPQAGLNRHILMGIRLPRVLLGALVGGGLGASGAALQSVFRNPLADPGLIGVTGGAALGAVGWIVLGGALAAALGVSASVTWGVPVAAFLGALGVCAIIVRVGASQGRVDVATMLLAGLAINALAGALIGLATYLADEAELRTLTMWSLGSLGGASWRQVGIVAAVTLPGLCALAACARSLNLLALGEREAGHLGVEVSRIKLVTIVTSALIVSVGVGFTGMIGFIGLVVPHLLRLALGPDARLVVPGASLLGASLLVLADLLARTIAAPAEIPIGVVTALLGAPFFLGLVLRARNQIGGML